MELISYLGLLGLVVGALYLVLAVISYSRSRQRVAEQGEERSEIVLNVTENPLESDGPVPERMRKLAAICAMVGRSAFKQEFDYSVESIARLDQAIVSAWGETEELPAQEVVLSFGAYVGEVLVRRTRGRWVSGLSASDPANILFLGPTDDDAVSFSPFLFVREKFDNMYGFDLGVAFTALEQKLNETKMA